jgi:hypothetical protein
MQQQYRDLIEVLFQRLIIIAQEHRRLRKKTEDKAKDVKQRIAHLQAQSEACQAALKETIGLVSTRGILRQYFIGLKMRVW